MSQKRLSNEELIEGIVDSLRDSPNTDLSLLEILVEYVLDIDVESKATDNAADAIEKLARRRAEGLKDDHAD